MGSQGPKQKNHHSFIKTTKFAIEGLWHAFVAERNVKIHTIFLVLVIGGGLLFRFTLTEWMILLLTVGSVISLELVNTAIERVVDLITTEKHPLAKQAKDVAAGAVLFSTIIAIVVGICLFLPHIVKWLGIKL